jgi:hypothetical protein
MVREVLSGVPAELDAGRLTIKTPPRTAQIYVTERRITGAIAWPIFASRT